MKIYAPVKNTNGVYASVRFVNGVGETDNPRLIEWFKAHGYGVEKSLEKCDKPIEKPLEKSDEDFINYIIESQNDIVDAQNERIEPDFDKMTPNELRDWMRENGYGSKIKNTRNKEKLLEILRG